MLARDTWDCLGLDDEWHSETTSTVSDAASKAYVNGMSDAEWLAATLMRLGSAFWEDTP